MRTRTHVLSAHDVVVLLLIRNTPGMTQARLAASITDLRGQRASLPMISQSLELLCGRGFVECRRLSGERANGYWPQADRKVP